MGALSTFKPACFLMQNSPVSHVCILPNNASYGGGYCALLFPLLPCLRIDKGAVYFAHFMGHAQMVRHMNKKIYRCIAKQFSLTKSRADQECQNSRRFPDSKLIPRRSSYFLDITVAPRVFLQAWIFFERAGDCGRRSGK